MKCWKYNPHERRCSQAEVCVRVCVCGVCQWRGKVFYVGGAVGGGGGGGIILRQIETENRAIAYALS